MFLRVALLALVLSVSVEGVPYPDTISSACVPQIESASLTVMTVGDSLGYGWADNACGQVPSRASALVAQTFQAADMNVAATGRTIGTSVGNFFAIHRYLESSPFLSIFSSGPDDVGCAVGDCADAAADSLIAGMIAASTPRELIYYARALPLPTGWVAIDNQHGAVSNTATSGGANYTFKVPTLPNAFSALAHVIVGGVASSACKVYKSAGSPPWEFSVPAVSPTRRYKAVYVGDLFTGTTITIQPVESTCWVIGFAFVPNTSGFVGNRVVYVPAPGYADSPFHAQLVARISANIVSSTSVALPAGSRIASIVTWPNATTTFDGIHPDGAANVALGTKIVDWVMSRNLSRVFPELNHLRAMSLITADARSRHDGASGWIGFGPVARFAPGTRAVPLDLFSAVNSRIVEITGRARHPLYPTSETCSPLLECGIPATFSCSGTFSPRLTNCSGTTTVYVKGALTAVNLTFPLGWVDVVVNPSVLSLRVSGSARGLVLAPSAHVTGVAPINVAVISNAFFGARSQPAPGPTCLSPPSCLFAAPRLSACIALDGTSFHTSTMCQSGPVTLSPDPMTRSWAAALWDLLGFIPEPIGEV